MPIKFIASELDVTIMVLQREKWKDSRTIPNRRGRRKETMKSHPQRLNSCCFCERSSSKPTSHIICLSLRTYQEEFMALLIMGVDSMG